MMNFIYDPSIINCVRRSLLPISVFICVNKSIAKDRYMILLSRLDCQCRHELKYDIHSFFFFAMRVDNKSVAMHWTRSVHSLFHPSIIDLSIHSSLLTYSFYSVQCHYHFSYEYVSLFFLRLQSTGEKSRTTTTTLATRKRKRSSGWRREKAWQTWLYLSTDSPFPLGQYKRIIVDDSETANAVFCIKY
jgi:hypothetical protein